MAKTTPQTTQSKSTTTTSAKDPFLVRFASAKQRRQGWNETLDEAYAHVLPQYEKASTTGTGTKGEKRGTRIFDSTAPEALSERANRTLGILAPKGRKSLFVKAEMAENNTENARYAEDAFLKLQSALEKSNHQIALLQTLRDCYISTGCIALDKGTADNPLSFEALPISQIIPEEASDGVIRTNYREYELEAHELPVRLPDASFPEEITQDITANPNKKISFVECQVYEEDNRSVHYKLFLAKGDHLVDERTFGVGRLITHRLDTVPGETMGRGPVLQAMPDIKTINKVVELVLKNASIAVTGIWQADDDGVLNPATVSLTPGTIIPKAVGSQGLTPLQAPGDFNVSQLVLSDLRPRVRRAIYGPDLPPLTGGVRSATEFGMRQADMLAVEVPTLERLESELLRPIVRRALYILTDPFFIGSSHAIDVPEDMSRLDLVGILMEMLETPAERAKRQLESQEQHSAVQVAIQSDPEGAPQVIHMQDYWRDFLANTGMKSSLLKSKQEIAEEQAIAEQQQQQVQLAQLASQAVTTGGDSSGEDSSTSDDPGAAIDPVIQQLLGGAGVPL